VQVNDPEQTQTDFQAAIDQIREQVVSCNIAIPPPPDGETLDPNKVNVELTLGGTVVPLSQNVTCEDGVGWRYDDPGNRPRSTCAPPPVSKSRRL
jgi:hypothetical protein